MSFAVWKNVYGNLRQYDRGQKKSWGERPFKHIMAKCFVVDIPEGTTAEAVLKKLEHVDNDEEWGFQPQWPLMVNAAFMTEAVPKNLWTELE